MHNKFPLFDIPQICCIAPRDNCIIHISVAGVERNGAPVTTRFSIARAPKGGDMSEHIYKIIELVGSATTGTDDAIRNAISRAALTIKHMDWFEVVETR
jgi:hypothetical protein